MYAGEIRKGALLDRVDGVADEDVLTAGALQALDFLPPDLAAAVIETWIDRADLELPIAFWPCLDAAAPFLFSGRRPTEPDAVLRSRSWIALVEAKCGAEFGDHQIEREIDVLLQELERTGMSDGLLVLLLDASGREAVRTLLGTDASSLVEGLKSRAVAAGGAGGVSARWQALVDGRVRVEVVVRHWDEYLDALAGATAGAEDHVRRLTDAVRGLLERHTLVRPRARGVERFARHQPISVTAVRTAAVSSPLERLARRGARQLPSLASRFREIR